MEQLGHYATSSFSNAKDIKVMLTTLSEVNIPEPVDPLFPTTRTQQRMWERKVNQSMDRIDDYEQNKHSIYSVALGQCSPAMKAKLKSTQIFAVTERNHDIVELLKSIKSIFCRFDSRTYFLEALINVKIAYYCIKQSQDESVGDYYARLWKAKEIAKHYGAEITEDLSLIKHELLLEGRIESLSDPIDHLVLDLNELMKKGAHRLDAYVFIVSLDGQRYGELQKALKKSLITNTNAYPECLADAYNMAIQYDLTSKEDKSKNRGPKPKRKEQSNDNKDKPTGESNSSPRDEKETPEGVSLFQDTSTTSDPATPANADDAKELNNDQVQLLQQEIDLEDDSDEEPMVHFMLNQTHRHRSKIGPCWGLLDSESTCHIFNNKQFLKNIWPCSKNESITINSNGNGSLKVNLIGDLPGVGAVYYHPCSVANVLSLAKITENHRVIFDSNVDNAFVVHGNTATIRFNRSPSGLYYYDVSVPRQHNTLVTTVKDNKSLFTTRELRKIEQAKQLYALVGRPSHEIFLDMIRHNRLKIALSILTIQTV